MPEVDLKKFLREHGFRHDGDHDRGSYWTNGDARISVRKNFDKEPGLLRALMDQVREAERRKKKRVEVEQKKYEEQVTKANRAPLPPSWPEGTATMSTKDLVCLLVERGLDAQRIADGLNSKGHTHPMGSKWTALEIQEWFPVTRLQPQTPEEHARAQTESAKSMAPPAEPEVRTRDVGAGSKKFAGEERMYVYGRIKAMTEAKMRPSAIAAALTSEGIVTPNGKLIDGTFVTTTWNRWETKPEIKAKYPSILMPRLASGKLAPEPPPPRPVVVAPSLPPTVSRSRFDLPLSIDTVLHDKEVSDDERLQVLMIFVEVPASADALLGDPSLPVAQKIAVIEAVGKRREGERREDEKSAREGT